MTNLRRVSVFGGREITQDIYDETVILGNMLAKEGYTIFCGGGRCNGGNIKRCRKGKMA